MEVPEDIREKAEPFQRVLNIIDAIPNGFKPSDDTPLRDALPGIWPTIGELRALVGAIRDRQ